MMAFLVRRLASGVVLLLALTLATFAVYYLIPYNPGYVLAGPTATPAQLRAADHQLGVDQPIYVQYGHFLWRLIRHADLGQSFVVGHGAPVAHILANDGGVTLSLVIGGGVVLLLLAVPLALLSALRPHSWIDRSVLTLSLFGIALHPFIVGVILKDIFGQTLNLLPTLFYCPLQAPAKVANPPGCNPATGLGCVQLPCGGHGGFWPWFSHLILPWLTFALFFLPFYVRIIRTRLVELLGEPYVITARMKGASEFRIVRHHILRGAAATTLAMLALDLGTSITAAIYVETVYGLPGLGSDALLALGNTSVTGSNPQDFYDLPFLVGLVFVVGVTLLVLNILADVVSVTLDPRLRLATRART